MTREGQRHGGDITCLREGLGYCRVSRKGRILPRKKKNVWGHTKGTKDKGDLVLQDGHRVRPKPPHQLFLPTHTTFSSFNFHLLIFCARFLLFQTSLFIFQLLASVCESFILKPRLLSSAWDHLFPYASFLSSPKSFQGLLHLSPSCLSSCSIFANTVYSFI